MSAGDLLEARIAVLAPSASDGPVTARVLAEAGLECVLARDGADLCRLVDDGAAAVLVAEEALDETLTRALHERFQAQPPWSDLPIILLTTRLSRLAGRLSTLESLAPFGNVTLLERPVEVLSLVTTVRVALRARRRQYAARAAMAEIARVEAERRDADLQRAEREAALVRGVVDNLPELAWTARPDGHIDFYNRRWFEYTGTTLEEMQGWGWEKVHDPEQLPKVRERWNHALSTGEPFELEFPIRRRDGVYQWFLTRVHPLRDAEGRIERWIGSNTNIDELRRSREELQRTAVRLSESLERFEALFEQSHVGKVLIDTERRIVDANDAFARMLGYDRVELLGGRIDDLTHPDDRGGNAVEVEELQSTGHVARRKRFLTRAGAVVWVDLHATAVHENARVLGLKEMVDITQQLEAEQAVARNQAILDAFFNAAPIGLAWLDRDARFKKINPRLAEVNGLPGEVHIDQALGDVLPGLPADVIMAQVKTVLATHRATDVEIVGETPAARGAQRVWSEQWFPLTLGEEVFGVGVTVREITDEKRRVREREELLVREQAARTQAERAASFAELFVAMLSHDLRNPLGAIQMGASLLANKAEDERARNITSRILTSVQRMERMIGQILDFTRIRAGMGLPCVPRAIDLRDVVARAGQELESDQGERRVRVAISGDTRGCWDGDRLAQVFSNLLANALEHSPARGEVRVTVDARAAERVTITVENPGAIPAELLPEIFEPFRQGRQHAHSRGLGLGLYITKDIVTAHGGAVDVTSSQDAGTRFRVVLPRTCAQPSSTASVAQA